MDKGLKAAFGHRVLGVGSCAGPLLEKSERRTRSESRSQNSRPSGAWTGAFRISDDCDGPGQLPNVQPGFL